MRLPRYMRVVQSRVEDGQLVMDVKIAWWGLPVLLVLGLVKYRVPWYHWPLVFLRAIWISLGRGLRNGVGSWTSRILGGDEKTQKIPPWKREPCQGGRQKKVPTRYRG